MPTTWTRADTTWSAAAYTWSDFSVATELLYMVDHGRSGRYKTDQIYADFFKDRAAKKEGLYYDLYQANLSTYLDTSEGFIEEAYQKYFSSNIHKMKLQQQIQLLYLELPD